MSDTEFNQAVTRLESSGHVPASDPREGFAPVQPGNVAQDAELSAQASKERRDTAKIMKQERAKTKRAALIGSVAVGAVYVAMFPWGKGEAPKTDGQHAGLAAGIEAQTIDNAAQTAWANGENPAKTITLPSQGENTAATEGQYSDLAAGIEAQTADNAAQTANANGELPPQ